MSLPVGYRPASFRGIGFLVADSEHKTGMVSVRHEFPGKAGVVGEILRRGEREFHFNAFVLGADYRAQRDALLKALEQTSPGTLVHPFYGTRTVICDSEVRVLENEKRRTARITLSFYESAPETQPASRADGVSGAIGAVSAAIDAANSKFAEVFSVAKKPAFLLDEATAKLGEATDLVQKATKTIRNQAQGIADLALKARRFKADLRDLINTPAKLAERFTNALSFVNGILPGGNSKDLARVFLGIAKFGSDFAAVPVTTANRLQQSKNQTAMVNLVNQQAVASAAGQAVQGTYGSLEEAVALRDELAVSIEAVLDSTDDDTVFSTFQALKAALVAALPADEQSLPRLVTVTPGAPTVSLVLAYELYGDLSLEEDIIARNHLWHPGIIPAARPLTVLGRAA